MSIICLLLEISLFFFLGLGICSIVLDKTSPDVEDAWGAVWTGVRDVS